MPKRTNVFQGLIALIHKQLAPINAKVTESKLIEDASTRQVREVDVTIEYEVAGYPLTIAVECRDHARPQDVTWIEQLHGKYRDTKVNKVVAVSKSGFTHAATEKANSFNIEALTLEAATDVAWLERVKNLGPVRVTIVGFELAGIDVKLIDKSIQSSDVPPMDPRTAVINSLRGTLATKVLDIYDDLAAREDFGRHLLSRPARIKDGLRETGVRLEAGAFITDPNGRQHLVEGVMFLVRTKIEEHEVGLEAGVFNRFPVATGHGRGTDFQTEIAVVRLAGQEPGMALTIRALKGSLPPGTYRLYGAD